MKTCCIYDFHSQKLVTVCYVATFKGSLHMLLLLVPLTDFNINFTFM